MKTGMCVALAILGFGLAVNGHASERIVVCAHYAVQSFGYSKGYEVQATYTDGQELNEATSTFNYMAYAKYVVIFWGQGEASVIRLDIPYLSYIPVTGTDQQGKKWQLSEMQSGSTCF